MPASTQQSSARLEKLAAKAAQNRTIFQNAYPGLYGQLVDRESLPSDYSNPGESYRSTLPTQSAFSSTSSSPPNDPKNTAFTEPFERGLAREISVEEYQAVMEKLVALCQLPPGKIDIETALYIEQQVGDLLGFQVATKLQNNELLYTHGTIKALPHLKRSPTDTTEEHTYSRAPFLEKRGYYGWSAQNTASMGSTDESEKYYIALPLHLLPNWYPDAALIKKWYAWRKMIVINPQEHVAVVCQVADTFDASTAKYQFGGSPELIIEGRCWSPASLGKVLIFFVVDDTNTIPLGPISLNMKDLYA